MRASSYRRFWGYLGGILLLAMVYLLTARLSIAALGLENELAKASPLWPPAGISLAMVILYGRRWGLGVSLGAFLVSASFSAQAVGLWEHAWSYWLLALVNCVGNGLQALVGAQLLQQAGFRPQLRQLDDLLKFLSLGVIVTPMVNATWATLISYIAGLFPLAQLFKGFWVLWLGDGMGILVMAPLLLVWLSETKRFKIAQGRRPTEPVRWQRNPVAPSILAQPAERPLAFTLEICLWLGLLLSVSWIVFGSPTGSAIANYPLEYLPFPFVVWGSLRLGLKGTVLCSLVVSIIAVVGAVQSGGPFITKVNGDVEAAVLLIQSYIAVISVTALVLVITVVERQQSEARLRRSEASLTHAQALARLGNWDLLLSPELDAVNTSQEQPSKAYLQWSDQLYQLLGYPVGSVMPDMELFLQRVHPCDRTRLQQALAQAVHDRQPYNLDYRLQLPDGSERVINEQVNIEPTLITGTVQDITERQQAEVALRESEQMRTTMYRYMSQELAEQLLQHGTTALGGERKFVSILFSDIRGYTTLTETLEPEATVEFLNSYFEMMVDVIFYHKGTLDKFIGDAIMAVFGSPLSLADHAQRAVKTALDMQQCLAVFNQQRLTQGYLPIQIGIGINSDDVLTGNIGSSKRMEFTAIGDGVNLSSRLEAATKQYGCDILISENTYRLCASEIVVRELDYIRVKGKNKPVGIYELIGLCSQLPSAQQQQQIQLYHQGRALYRQCHFQAAIECFREVLAIAPQDQAAALHLIRCQHLQQHPPADNWDGSWQLTEK